MNCKRIRTSCSESRPGSTTSREKATCQQTTSWPKRFLRWGVVVLTGVALALVTANIVPVVNQLVAQFDQLGIQERVKEAGHRMLFYEIGKATTSPYIWPCPWRTRQRNCRRQHSTASCLR